jgi:poly-gamma-glutamate synthesis protein (capsule biosynthesis protein)
VLPLILFAQNEPPFKLLFGGDIMLNQISPKRKPLTALRNLADKTDLFIGNLEIPLTSCKSRTTRKTAAELKARSQFILKADPAHIQDLKASGLRLVALANNHAMDFGPAGLRETTSLLAKAGIHFGGAGESWSLAARPAIVKARKKVALVSALAFMNRDSLWKCSPAKTNSPGIYVLSLGGKIDGKAKEQLRLWIGAARKEADLVVVGLHWGQERQTVPTPYQVALGRACVEAGADIVWGHHPHVLQGAEIYRGKPILYSLGNLVATNSNSTSLVSLSYSAKGVHLTEHPVLIRNGEAALSKGTGTLRKLSEVLARRFPHPDSENPFAGTVKMNDGRESVPGRSGQNQQAP